MGYETLTLLLINVADISIGNKKAIANMIDGNTYISDIRDLRAQRMSAVFVNDRANAVNIKKLQRIIQLLPTTYKQNYSPV